MTRTRYNRSRDNFVQRDWVPEKSVQSFLTLFKFIESKTGSQRAAGEYCDIPNGTMTLIRQGKCRMTALQARRIADGYKRIKSVSV